MIWGWPRTEPPPNIVLPAWEQPTILIESSWLSVEEAEELLATDMRAYGEIGEQADE